MIYKIGFLICAGICVLPVPFLPKIVPPIKAEPPAKIALERGFEFENDSLYDWDFIDIEAYELEEFFDNNIVIGNLGKSGIVRCRSSVEEKNNNKALKYLSGLKNRREYR
ncbi:MAG: hypothetical protein FWE13_02390 [Firmicutes bacterium]|nr:hypothetical protein [Bacillota bacterium]